MKIIIIAMYLKKGALKCEEQRANHMIQSLTEDKDKNSKRRH